MTQRLIVTTLMLAASAAFAQPRITRLVNSASYIPAGLPGSAIAQGSIFIISGTGLGPAVLVQNQSYPIPTTLSGVSIRISGGGQDLSAPMVYVLDRQVAAILPSATPVGNALARITVNGQTSDGFPLTVVRNGPGLYTLNSAGNGPAVITDANFGVITRTNAAVEGQTVIAWVTGVGAANVPDTEPPPAFDPPVTLEVFVGGKTANVRYRGRAPGIAGLDQVVFDVPAGSRGCDVSLVMRAGGGNISNFTTIPIAGPGRVCSDPNGFSESELSGGFANGLRYGVLGLSRAQIKLTVPQFGTLDQQTDAGSGFFSRFDANALVRSQGFNGGTSFGSCTVYAFAGQSTPADPIQPTVLDAGAALTITGGGATRTIPRVTTGGYGGDLGSATTTSVPLPPGFPGFGGNSQPLFLNPGEFTITGPGGRDVGAFTARITIPARFSWTNQDAITRINRGQELTVTWSGGNPSNEVITLVGSSSRRNPDVGASFVCTAPATAGQLTVPAIVTSALPAGEVIQGTPTGALVLSNSPIGGNRFTASGIDIGIIAYGTSFIKNLPVE